MAELNKMSFVLVACLAEESSVVPLEYPLENLQWIIIGFVRFSLCKVEQSIGGGSLRVQLVLFEVSFSWSIGSNSCSCRRFSLDLAPSYSATNKRVVCSWDVSLNLTAQLWTNREKLKS